jgi:hypothetical protein
MKKIMTKIVCKSKRKKGDVYDFMLFFNPYIGNFPARNKKLSQKSIKS